MKNLELECLPSWRFCRIPRGQKGPRYAGWQTEYLTLDQIGEGHNVGVILGPASAGVAALDFDGTSAWSWFTQNFPDLEIPRTVSWASGRTDRCQMAFTVPPAYWDSLKTIKIATGEREGFEFRWTGGQSVLPPSLHPDTGQEYFWVNAPDQTDLATLPDPILCHWLLAANPAPATHVAAGDLPPPTASEIAEIYADLKQFYPNLGYDRWCTAAWVAVRELGTGDGVALMKHLWPEQVAGEYQKLVSSANPNHSRVATIGSVIHWIRQIDPRYTPARTLTGMAAVNHLRRERNKLKNLIRNGY